MTQQIINIGIAANDRSGDPIRTAFNKVNQNFTELYILTGGSAEQLREIAQDYTAPLFTHNNNAGITFTYDDTNNQIIATTTTDIGNIKFDNNAIYNVNANNPIYLTNGNYNNEDDRAGIWIPSKNDLTTELRLYNINSDGGIWFGVRNGWLTIKPDGSIGFPTHATNQRTGNAEALVFNRGGANQKSIATQSGTVEFPTVERLVIAGGDSYQDPTSGVFTPYSEGGDIYLWAGRGADGGDIKIDAGNAYGVNSELGGDIKIRGGYSQSGTGGFIELTSGYGNGINGGYVNITANGGMVDGGDINISAGAGNTGYGGDITLTAGYGTTSGSIIFNTSNNHQWLLNSNGSTHLPGQIVSQNGTIKNGNKETISITDQTYASGGTNFTVWTASSVDIIAATVTVRVQSDMNNRTELFTVNVVKDATDINFTITNQVTSNVSYGASVITANTDNNGVLRIQHQDPNGWGNAYTVSVVEFTKSY